MESRSEESSGGRDMDRMEDLLGIPSPLYYRLILIARGVKNRLIEACNSDTTEVHIYVRRPISG
jgi:hypothetical protein